MSQIVLVGNEKGGVGKTTVAVNLAIMRALAGIKVILVDTDKQASASIYMQHRAESQILPANSPRVLCVQKFGKVGYGLLDLKASYEVIVDAGGRDSLELRQAIGVADTWILPVTPSDIDIYSIANMRALREEVLDRIGKAPRTLALMNKVNRSTAELQDARDCLSEFEDIDVIQTNLIDRVAWRRAVRYGCGLLELPQAVKDPQATKELIDVYQDIFGEEYHDRA